MQFRLYSHWHDLPAGYAELFARASAQDFCLSRAWFEALAATILEDGERLTIAGVEADGPPMMPRACLIGSHREHDSAFFGARSFSSLSNYYTLRYAPIVDDGDGANVLVHLIEGLRARRPRYAVLHFEPLAADAALSDDLAAALRGAGLVTRRYFRFGNWYHDTRGLSFRDYLGGRPAALRNTFRRNGARLARTGELRLAVVQDGAGLADALAQYEQVYAASWKRTEPYPAFMHRLAADLTAKGALRLGLLYLDHLPVAAQIWLVWRGRAVLYKLAHDRAFDALSPGTVLTMRMLERLLDGERVAELDLGAGDDPYKRLWASQRRARVGLIGFDPLTLRGAAGALRHLPGALLARPLHVEGGFLSCCRAPRHSQAP
jgi:CelD/BcsL family acetyltransferase involved in cellulose biosynthesis